MTDSGYEAFSAYYDCLTENVDYHQRALYFDSLIQDFQQSDGVVLLDLACGTGSLSEEMARLGYDVLGIDYSYGMLSCAMEKKMEHGLPIQYVCQDMRELQLYGTVDVTICTLDSLNHLDHFSEVSHVFQEIFEATQPGGLFLFDMNTVYKHREVLGDHVFVYETPSVYCVWENQYTPQEHTVSISLDFFTLQENGSYLRSREELTEHAYEADRIQETLREIGFEVLGCYHADTREPLRPNSQRMVLVARVPLQGKGEQ